jgi:hypothetical protein
MKRRRAAFVGGIRIGPASEQHFRNGKIARAHGLMKGCHGVTVPGINGCASLDEQRRDPGRPRSMRTTQVCDPMKRGFAEPVRYRDVRTSGKEVSHRTSPGR